MIVDGKAVAKEILDSVKSQIESLDRPIHLTIFTCQPNFETQKFLKLKQKAAAVVGISVTVVEWTEAITTEVAVGAVRAAVSNTNGVIVQLPLPNQLDQTAVVAAIPASHDVDVWGYDGTKDDVLPPVTGAIAAIAVRYGISFTNATVAVVGNGALVGHPTSLWATNQGSSVTILTKDSPEYAAALQAADIVILGIGQPGFIVPSMVKSGAVVFDAGTSESAGVLRGDADPAVGNIAAVFTPVPGGIGPVTIAILLRNLVTLATSQ